MYDDCWSCLPSQDKWCSPRHGMTQANDTVVTRTITAFIGDCSYFLPSQPSWALTLTSSFICFTQSKFSTNREIKFLIKSSSSAPHHLTARAQHNKIGWNQSKTSSCINLDNDFESDKKSTMINFPTPVSLRVAEVGGVVRIQEYFNSCWELNKFWEKRLAHLASPAKVVMLYRQRRNSRWHTFVFLYSWKRFAELFSSSIHGISNMN